MMQSSIRGSIDLIINSGEQLYQLAKNLNIVELEKEMPKYTQIIEAYFLEQNGRNLTQTELDELKELISTHKEITNLLSKKKETISKNLKQLHIGKEMQNTYPHTIS